VSNPAPHHGGSGANAFGELFADVRRAGFPQAAEGADRYEQQSFPD
jgi:hypothetical protein